MNVFNSNNLKQTLSDLRKRQGTINKSLNYFDGRTGDALILEGQIIASVFKEFEKMTGKTPEEYYE